MTHSAQTTPAAARLVLVGPQGSGKGTQAARIADRYGIAAISTGDVFRANIKDDTELGRQVKEVIDAGELVSDALTFDVVRDRLAQPDAASGFLLDGFPRNVAQLGMLDTYLADRDEPLTAVLELGVPREVSVDRLMRRAFEQGRTDDTEEVIANRLAIYESETAPILEVYRDRGLVDSIDGVGSLDEVTERVMDALEARGIVAVSV
ncbi:adenylate kinase [Microbacterium koreense]|uniref:Adenylate kinase n=1 Tax=Microbacterium koreense TaxID=323761 RepID=A0ABW2ZUJ7_9MICO